VQNNTILIQFQNFLSRFSNAKHFANVITIVKKKKIVIVHICMVKSQTQPKVLLISNLLCYYCLKLVVIVNVVL
jgi:uncharacterized membrane protein